MAKKHGPRWAKITFTTLSNKARKQWQEYERDYNTKRRETKELLEREHPKYVFNIIGCTILAMERSEFKPHSEVTLDLE